MDKQIGEGTRRDKRSGGVTQSKTQGQKKWWSDTKRDEWTKKCWCDSKQDEGKEEVVE